MGLDKIISTQEQVGGLQEQLTAMEPVLIKTQAEVEVMIITIIQDKEEAGKTQRTVSSAFSACSVRPSIIDAIDCGVDRLNLKTEETSTGYVEGGQAALAQRMGIRRQQYIWHLK